LRNGIFVVEGVCAVTGVSLGLVYYMSLNASTESTIADFKSIKPPNYKTFYNTAREALFFAVK